MLAAIGIVPSNSTTYTLTQIENAIKAQTGATPFVGCGGNGTFFERNVALLTRARDGAVWAIQVGRLDDSIYVHGNGYPVSGAHADVRKRCSRACVINSFYLFAFVSYGTCKLFFGKEYFCSRDR
ncbi:hypothetical protein EW145_g1892 [Phellinidium pouzarii]|uniref:Uncharacterized protein n=1 Tax=Phellinidium pouzarii TaxID=167371 RepID=A0A4S4LDA2_9AGAM|nr:hypothetical protein EW145_g1892 [Phellinidium pouzarii]